MSASPDLSSFDQNLSELSENEHYTTSTTSNTDNVPRIKLKIRLNTTSTPVRQLSSDYEDNNNSSNNKKHKRKKKRSHKKHKHKHDIDTDDIPSQDRRYSEQVDIDDDEEEEDDDEKIVGNDNNKKNYPNYHMPVGGKRPFAMLQQQQQQQQQEDEDEEVYMDNEDEDYGDNYLENIENNEYAQSIDEQVNDDDDDEDEDDDDDDEEERDDEDEDDDDEGDEDEDMNSVHPTDNRHSSKSKSKTNNNKKSNRSKKTTITSKKSKKSSTSKSSKNNSQSSKKRGRPTKKSSTRVTIPIAPPVAKLPPMQQSVPKDQKIDLQSHFLKLWDTLSKRDDYGVFLEPVDTKVVKDYLSIIKRPMDFSTMKKKIDSHKYKTITDFKKDFLLIVQNAKLYNRPNTIYWKSANKLEKYGVKAIDRVEKQINEMTQQQQQQLMNINNRQYSWQQQQHQKAIASSSTPSLSSTTRKDSIVIKEEEVDILGLDGPIRKSSRVESETATREPSVDIQSRAMTPTRQLKKKKKKKVSETGVIYGPDGSLHAVGGVIDINGLIPSKQPFCQAPQLSSINPQALPSAFYQSTRTVHDDWSSHKHFLQPAVFCDYGPFPFTTLGSGTPSVFYRPQDAQFVYSFFGDDTGEAYLKSIWQFMEEVGLEDKATLLSQHITRGGWDVMKRVIDLMNKKNNNTNGHDGDDENQNDHHEKVKSEEVKKEEVKEEKGEGEKTMMKTEFDDIDIEKILNELQYQNKQQQPILPSSENNNATITTTTSISTPSTINSTLVTENTTIPPTTQS